MEIFIFIFFIPSLLFISVRATRSLWSNIILMKNGKWFS